ncbi:MAG: hypothetical protein KC469_13325 [Flavobacteriaceae bacterium]|nr:hypothetical protein [Flavobacteriaceae bacterium]
MKSLYLTVCLVFIIFSCHTTKDTHGIKNKEVAIMAQDTVRIANDELEYEILIIEPGFNNWLIGRAKPEGFYTQQYLENRNRLWVTAWNNRVLNPNQFDPLLYEAMIDYQHHIDYGYDVNYKLYYYFVYFQLEYNQQLGGIVPSI